MSLLYSFTYFFGWLGGRIVGSQFHPPFNLKFGHSNDWCFSVRNLPLLMPKAIKIEFSFFQDSVHLVVFGRGGGVLALRPLPWLLSVLWRVTREKYCLKVFEIVS